MITGDALVNLANRWSILALDQGGGEAVWRTAIGRAYYGAFHVSLKFLDDLGIRQKSSASKRDVHQWVRIVLQHGSNADLLNAGKKLGELHEYRKDADYRLHVTEHGEQPLSQQCHMMANDICDLIAACDSTKHAAVKASIEAWLKMSSF